MKTRTPTPLVEHAGSGFLMPEATARRIDALARGLPRDFTYRRRRAGGRAGTGPRGAAPTSAPSPPTRSIVIANAFCRPAATGRLITEWCRSRTITGNCRPGRAGGSSPGRRAGSRLIAKTHYPAKPADWGDAPWLPSAVLHLLQQPVPTCTGKSIGFLPLNIREASRDEVGAPA